MFILECTQKIKTATRIKWCHPCRIAGGPGHITATCPSPRQSVHPSYCPLLWIADLSISPVPEHGGSYFMGCRRVLIEEISVGPNPVRPDRVHCSSTRWSCLTPPHCHCSCVDASRSGRSSRAMRIKRTDRMDRSSCMLVGKLSTVGAARLLPGKL